MGFLGQMVANKASGADSASKKAAQLQADASQRANDIQLGEYNQTRQDQMPWLQSGQGALNLLNRAAGIATPGVAAKAGTFDAGAYLNANPDVMANDWARTHPYEHYQMYGQYEDRPNKDSWFTGGQDAIAATPGGAPDLSAFTASPGYQFRLAEGQKAGQNAFAAKGGAYSGNALKALADYNQNSASAEYGNWWNQIAGLAGVGQTSANTLASVGQNYAGAVGNNLMQGADARASGIIGTAAVNRNAFNQGMQNDAQNFGYFSKFGGNNKNYFGGGDYGYDNVGY